MIRLNDYFTENKHKKIVNQRMSLCGKLEAMIGNYFLSGAGKLDSGKKYVNPKHFSVVDIAVALS